MMSTPRWMATTASAVALMIAVQGGVPALATAAGTDPEPEASSQPTPAGSASTESAPLGPPAQPSPSTEIDADPSPSAPVAVDTEPPATDPMTEDRPERIEAALPAPSVAIAPHSTDARAFVIDVGPNGLKWRGVVQRHDGTRWRFERNFATRGDAATRSIISTQGRYRVVLPAQHGHQRFLSAAYVHAGADPAPTLNTRSDGALLVDYPDRPGDQSWSFTLQRRTTSRGWVTVGTGRTRGTAEKATFVVRSGTYRLVTPSGQFRYNGDVTAPDGHVFVPRVRLSSPKSMPGFVRVNVDPNLPGNRSWTVRLERLTGGSWEPVATSETRGKQEIVWIKAAAGQVRAYLHRGYAYGGNLYSATHEHTITNSYPQANRDTKSAKAGKVYHVNVLANDTDPDNDPISLVKVRSVRGGGDVRASVLDREKLKIAIGPTTSGKVYISYVIKDKWGARDNATLAVKVTLPAASPYGVERTLSRLGLPVGRVDGYYDAHTRRAVCAWREIVGKGYHRGLPDSSEARQIAATASLPRARSHMVTGMNINKTCQTGMWVSGKRTFKFVAPVTTGLPQYETRSGTWRIFWSYPGMWQESSLYPGAMMYRPKYFSGGQAIHGSSSDSLVKTYPASHGCVRMLHKHIDQLHSGGFGTGDLVKIYGRY